MSLSRVFQGLLQHQKSNAVIKVKGDNTLIISTDAEKHEDVNVRVSNFWLTEGLLY